MAHLTPDDLRAWSEGHLDHDRQRVVLHLAECTDCAARLAAIVRESETGPVVELSPVDVFREAGYRLGPGAVRGAWFDWRRLAVAAAVLLAVGGGLYVTGRPPAVDRGSSGEVVMQSPIGEVAASSPVRFAWSGIDGPARLLVVDVAESSTPLVDRMVTGASTELLAGERARFEGGKIYHWFLEYEDAAGARHSTPTSRFSLRY